MNEFRSITGQGVLGKIENHEVGLGNAKLFDELKITLPQSLMDRAESLRRDGQTAMFVAVDGQSAGLLGVADPIKSSTPEAIQQLHADGVRIVMLTGDSRTTAAAVASKLGIDDVQAEVAPADKGNVIKRFQDEGHIVAMAGDGINDAPALAQAEVGIAMGTGTDVAMESAGLTLIQGDLRGIAESAPPEPRSDGQHPPEFILRVYLQRARRADCRWRAVSTLRACGALESDDCRRGDELQQRFGHHATLCVCATSSCEIKNFTN